MTSPWLRTLAGALIVAISAAGVPTAASAQYSADTGIVNVTVSDGGQAEKTVLRDARVTILGPITASALTTASGIVKYTDVPTGIYRIRVVKPGFQGSTSAAFEVLGNKQVDVDVALGRQNTNVASTATSQSSNGLQIIGRVQARVTVNTHDVDQDSGVRRISDSLTDALSKIAGVDVTQDSNDPNSPQTVSLRGKDESQTAVTLDGIPLGAPGSAVNLRSVNTDLFAGASANFGASAGALAGTVNFRTLQPTQTWQSRFSTSYGTYDRFNYQLGETGSLGKLGIALLHTDRGGNSPLTFNTFTDQSGLNYAHGGESTNVGNFFKLRYSLGDRTTLNLTGLQNNQGTSALCTQFVTLEPCGIGPGNVNYGKFQFGYATLQTLVGETAINVASYVNSNVNTSDDVNRYLNGVRDPFLTTTSSVARGGALSLTATRGKHTLTLTGSTYAGVTSFTPNVATAQTSRFVVNTSTAVNSRTANLADAFKVNDKLSLGENVSVASVTGASSSILGGVSAAWRPTASDSFNGSVSLGSAQSPPGIARTYSDPRSARVNCYAGTASVNGPGDLPGPQASQSYDLGWVHQWRTGQINVDLYRQNQSGQLINAQVAAPSLGFSSTDPYVQAIQQTFALPTVCGSSFGQLQPQNIFVSEPFGGSTRVYQGFSVSGRIGLGPNVTLLPNYSTSGAVVTAADPRLTGLNSTVILGSQIAGRPLHRGNLTVDVYHPPSKVEFLANVSYTGGNNAQHLNPYTLVNAGISHDLGIGKLTVFASNLFNSEAGAFSSLLYAQPIPLSGGGTLLTAANPNTPRQYTVTYSFNTGARPGSGFARPSGGASGTAARGGAGGPGAFGFGQFKFVAPPAGTDPLTLAGTSVRPECTADLVETARTTLARLGAAATAYAATGATPAVPGVAITPHGDRTGAWWFGLAPEIPESALPQRPPGAGGGPGFGPGGGPGGEGPPPGGFQQRVVVGPNTDQPRPQFTPSPALLAAIKPFRALASCSYASVLTPDEVKAQGLDVPAPGFRPPSPGRRFGGNFLDYAPKVGIFVVRAPDLGTGGGSVKK